MHRDGPHVDITRAVDNLLDNAVAAAGEQGKVVCRVAAEGELVRLDIADDGAGLDETQHDRLFEPFFTTKNDGVGLGLWLARFVAETAGGTLTYRRDDATTVFSLVLPRTPRAS